MSWSLAYNGKRSPIKDSYQRVALITNINDVGADFAAHVVTLSKVNLLHIGITISEEMDESNIGDVLEKIQVLYDLEHEIDTYNQLPNVEQQRRLFLSLQMPHNAKFLMKSIVALDFHFDLWILNVDGEKEQALRNVMDAHGLIQQASKQTSLGIGNVENALELDWLLCKLPEGTLKFVHLGDLMLPDLRTHCIELVHSVGLNAMCNISAAELEKEMLTSPLLLELSDKYDVDPDTFIIKCMLQLGSIVGVPYAALTPEYIEERYARLGHPFVHRRAFASANKVVSLLVAPEDMGVLITLSEQHEARSTDSDWQEYATGKAAARALSYSKVLTSY